MVRLFAFVAVAVCVPVVAGCTGGAADAPQVVPTTGKVTVDGKSYKGMTVSFVPDASKKATGPLSSGVTNAKGEFTVYTPGNQEGAVVGWHKVVVSCPLREDMQSSPTGDTSQQETPAAPCTVPDNYTLVATTTLTAEVKAEGNKPHNFAITTAK